MTAGVDFQSPIVIAAMTVARGESHPVLALILSLKLSSLTLPISLLSSGSLSSEAPGLTEFCRFGRPSDKNEHFFVTGRLDLKFVYQVYS